MKNQTFILDVLDTALRCLHQHHIVNPALVFFSVWQEWLNNGQHYVYERLVVVQRTLERLDNPTLKLYFLFLDEVLPLFNHFNKLLQSEWPLLHVLHSGLIVVFLQEVSSEIYSRGSG